MNQGAGIEIPAGSGQSPGVTFADTLRGFAPETPTKGHCPLETMTLKGV